MDESFRRVLDIALPNGGCVVATVEAYFDESGTHEGAVAMCMAGYIFEKTRSEILEQQWEVMLRRYDDIPCFHVVDCFQGREAFKGWPRERRTALEEEVIKIIWTRAIYAIDMLLQYSQEQAAMIQGSQGLLATVRFLLWCGSVLDRSKIGLKRLSIPGMSSPCLNRCQKIMEKFR